MSPQQVEALTLPELALMYTALSEDKPANPQDVIDQARAYRSLSPTDKLRVARLQYG